MIKIQRNTTPFIFYVTNYITFFWDIRIFFLNNWSHSTTRPLQMEYGEQGQFRHSSAETYMYTSISFDMARNDVPRKITFSFTNKLILPKWIYYTIHLTDFNKFWCKLFVRLFGSQTDLASITNGCVNLCWPVEHSRLFSLFSTIDRKNS